jgi:thymidylate kinase
MRNAGQLIIFEGADATGKSSISAGVCEEIRNRGVPIELLSFPGKAPHSLGNLVYRIHHDCQALDIESLTPLSRQALHIAAHLDAIETKILPLLENGTWVILDRFWWSTFVYGIADGVDRQVLQGLIDAEKLLWAEWAPQILFYVTRDTPLRDEPAEKWQRWIQLYRELLTSEAGHYPIRVIENDNSLETAVSRVLSLIQFK